MFVILSHSQPEIITRIWQISDNTSGSTRAHTLHTQVHTVCIYICVYIYNYIVLSHYVLRFYTLYYNTTISVCIDIRCVLPLTHNYMGFPKMEILRIIRASSEGRSAKGVRSAAGPGRRKRPTGNRKGNHDGET